MTEHATLEQLGVNGGTITGMFYGEEFTVSVGSDNKFDDLISQLAAYDIHAYISNGIITLKGADHSYITAISGLEKLGLSVGDGETWETYTNTYYDYADSDVQDRTITITMGMETTFEDLSCTGGTITGTYQGKEFSINATANQSINDLLTALAAFGIFGEITDGKLTLKGSDDVRISSISGDIITALKLAFDTKEVTDYANDESNLIDMYHDDLLIKGDTVLSMIDGLVGGQLAVHQTNGHFTTINVDASMTVDEFFSQIAEFGLIGTVDTNGIVTITGVGNLYLQSVGGGSNILSKLNLSNVVEKYQTVTVNRSSDTLHHTITVEASGTTALGDLIHSDGNGIGTDYSMVLEYTSDAGNDTVTLTFTEGSTLHNVIDKLKEFGINATIDSAGRFCVDSYLLDDFDLTGNLAEFLMGSYSKVYGEDVTYNTTTNLRQKIVVTMEDHTKLSEFGITSGNIEIVQHGTSYTVAIDGTGTVGDFRTLLGQYGFESFIDEKGQLNVVGIGESYLKEIAGGSNILDVMGLTDWTVGISQESTYLTDTDVIRNRVITMDDVISELTDENGNDLNITDGNIYIYQDGTRYAFAINTDETLYTLATRLSQYGITMGLSETGRLYFDGNNDSYMTTQGISSGASNILDKFVVNGNTWNTRYDSTSENLFYTVEEDEKLTGSTRMVDLQDSSGNSLGITEGSYYVYQNGVRYTEEITDDTTVDDFRATMAGYGLITDISENGEISVGAYNDTYLETSAYATANSNVVDALFETSWEFVNIYESNNLTRPIPVIEAISRDTKLAKINEGDDFVAGYITVIKDGVQTDIEITAEDTVGTFIDELSLYGFETVINDEGQVIIRNTGDSKLQAYVGATGTASNILDILGVDLNNWINTNSYSGETLEITRTRVEDIAIDRETKLSEILVDGVNFVTAGEYYIYSNGVKYTAMISSDETVGSLIDSLRSFGLDVSLVLDQDTDSGILKILGSGESYITSKENGSNVVGLFNPVENMYKYEGYEEISYEVTSTPDATEATLLSYYDDVANDKQAEGTLILNIDGKDSIIHIYSDDTFGTLINKFNALGLKAHMADGKVVIESAYLLMTIKNEGTSDLLETIGLVYNDDIGGYVSTSATQDVEQTVTIVEQITQSAAHYANMGTKMRALNIIDGTLSVYRNGELALINIEADDTFDDLQAAISTEFGDDVKVKFDEGFLTFYSDKADVKVDVGASTDKGNFAMITGIVNDGSGTVKSIRELFSVHSDSRVMESGIFRAGNVTEGSFIVGDAEFEITSETTLKDLISQINASEASGATAYWDSIDGKLVIKSRSTGSTYINIQAGFLSDPAGNKKASNFTDILGLTNCEWDDEANGDLKISRMDSSAQDVGDNARFSINGTYYSSTSNTIGSDVSRLKGLTINLKGITEGEKVTLEVEKDKETVANAVSSIVDAYNELMKNVDETLQVGGQLHQESTLRMIRNELKNLMTSSIMGSSIYKNLSQIGISTAAASLGNISTTHDAIVSLQFDRDAFIKAYDAEPEALKELLMGGDGHRGILIEVEELIEGALEGGYFTSAEKSVQKQISRLDEKIIKQSKAVEKYRARLEAKFASMDLLIAQMQQQYSSFMSV
ncbi:MAG: hypothetical protein E7Z89_05350 [Cyanobacteria bacterium SIG28]|nr:hypothetical protein [Cyanobacteria bacterium SIG28]